MEQEDSTRSRATSSACSDGSRPLGTRCLPRHALPRPGDGGLADPTARGDVPQALGAAWATRPRPRSRSWLYASGASPARLRLFWFSLLGEGLALSMAMSSLSAGRSTPSTATGLDLGLVGLAEFLPLPLLALQPRATSPTACHAAGTRRCAGARHRQAPALLVVTLAWPETIWPFILLAFATGVAASLGAPAGRSHALLVPEDRRAVEGPSIAFQGAVVVGPRSAGCSSPCSRASFTATGIALTLTSLGFIVQLHTGRTPTPVGAPGLDSVLAGVRLIRRMRAAGGDLARPLRGAARRRRRAASSPPGQFYVGPTGLGVLRSAPAVGALAAGLVLARHPSSAGSAPCCCPWSRSSASRLSCSAVARALAVGTCAGGGGAAEAVSRPSPAHRPVRDADPLRGRVTAVEMVFISASNELGAFESGVAAALLARAYQYLGGVATIAAALWLFLFRGAGPGRPRRRAAPV